ncbi:hypothetical protein ACB098_07G063900 [Castanea mollissima]
MEYVLFMVIADAASQISHYTTSDQICICWQCILARLHKKLFILLGTTSFHFCFHMSFVCSEDDPNSLELFFDSVLREKYTDLTVYSLDCTKGQNTTSFASPQLKGILWTWSASVGLRAVVSKFISQLCVTGFMSVLTVASWNCKLRGPCAHGDEIEGSQLSPQILIASPFPTFHFAPFLMTSRPFKILFLA